MAEVARSGHSITFADYVQRESAALTGFAYAVTGNREDALDAVQDALIGAYPKWNRIVAKGDPGGYLRRSVLNSHINRRRSRKRVTPVAEVDTQRVDPHAVDPGAGLAGQDWTLRMLAILPRRERAAVALRFIEDLDSASIGRIIGCSPGTARSLVSRGLARLRQELEESK